VRGDCTKHRKMMQGKRVEGDQHFSRFVFPGALSQTILDQTFDVQMWLPARYRTSLGFSINVTLVRGDCTKHRKMMQ